MNTVLDPAAAARTVIWGGLLLGLVLGVVGQASRFCVRGAIDDWVRLRQPGRMVSWLLAIAVAAFAVQALTGLQLFDARRTVAWGSNFMWLSALAGGAVFGFGMILAGGCPQRSLVKAGSGDLKALVTLVVTSIAALMTLRGAFAGWRVDFLDRWSLALATPQDIGSIAAAALPLPAGAIRAIAVVALLAIAGYAAWRHRAQLKRAHWAGGIAVGLLVPVAFVLTGVIGFIPEHPETLEAAWMGTQSRRPEGLTFAAPLAHSLDLLTLWSDRSTVATFGVLLALGVLAGSFASARLRGDFKLLSFGSPRELLSHLGGSVMMGFGGITALGCSIGQGLTGLALLSLGSVFAVAGIVAGAVLAIRWRVRGARVADGTAALREAGSLR